MLAICLGGLGAAFLYTSVADAHSVLRVNRTVFRGEVIQAADLGSVSVGSAVGLTTVPADRAAELIGSTALVDLPNGSLVVPGSVGQVEVKPGTARIGLRLTPGRLPASPLPAGTPVLLVAVAKDSEDASPGASVVAKVATSPVVQTDGAAVLDVEVPAGEAERLARLAAAERLVLVRRAEG